MRTTLLSRSVVAVASLAIGSAALAAVPASAATPSGITRDMVLTAAAGVRANPAAPSVIGFGNYGPEANRALRAMVNRTCGIDPDGPELAVGSISASTAGGKSADGVVVSAILYNLDEIDTDGSSGPPTGRLCSFGALATTAGRSVLTGTATLTGVPAAALSRDVFVTRASNRNLSVIFESDIEEALPTFTAVGSAVQSNPVKISTPKTAKQKKAAKKTYAKRLASAKKAYKKALDKAGSSKNKKKAAKKTYDKKRKAAKASYKKAVATSKIVIKKKATPFSVSAKFSYPEPPEES